MIKKILKLFISLQIALSPIALLASTQETQLTDTIENPLLFTDSQTYTLPSGEVHTLENTVTVAETEEQKEIAEKWFIDEVQKAHQVGTKVRVVGASTEGAHEINSANELKAKLEQSGVESSFLPIKKSILESVKAATSRFVDQAKKPLAKWIEKRPEQFKKVFAMSRLLINGISSSIVFNYYFLDGAIPTWLAWTAGMTLGAFSGAFNYFFDVYSKWLDRKVDDKTVERLQKILPFLSAEFFNEAKSLSKWALLESIFLAIPITMFQYLPTLLGQGDGFAFAPSWAIGIAAVSASLATAMVAQYPWDKGVSRAFTVDIFNAENLERANWVKFRTALMFVVISALQVTITSLSLGDYKFSSYFALGAIGLAGLIYRSKIMKRTNSQFPKGELKNVPTKCEDIISYLIPNSQPNTLSWVS